MPDAPLILTLSKDRLVGADLCVCPGHAPAVGADLCAHPGHAPAVGADLCAHPAMRLP